MPTAAIRLALRLSLSDKALVTHAANVQGVPVSVFMRNAVLREAERVIAAPQVVPNGSTRR
ncbi:MULTISPECIES: DUF1778 domain-containing protein [Stenotrophomonas]|jgi:uncharacterized protein (DUF1778 family)|uniref:type II toxin -antitoxin system TacA 1-like antitoxin n=1 Tax=Stenotrophomonas TaxID=40323 RepID=UPI00201CC3E7|nr:MULTISPECIES: DUF1778 domain-containing protein [Stenotrophomonas]MDQ1062650.1 uncharacterized protein (DUF1778 family) [Stenotrophomonas sp. SORGH_AS_0282]MDQ1188995.1 uncharacterized protein (DUF1778 family) [Stenotrophomonas sp. SORGH_AS_0282]UQY89523.1 DUF1778 domain-containing protein [Stenotrophomonas rhizophila]